MFSAPMKKRSSREYIWKFQRGKLDTLALICLVKDTGTGGRKGGRNSREMDDVLEGQRDGRVN